MQQQLYVSAIKINDVRKLLQKMHMNPIEAVFLNNIQTINTVKEDLRHPIESA